MENNRFNVLQTLLVCDRYASKNTIPRPAVDALVRQAKMPKEVIIIGGRAVEPEFNRIVVNQSIHGFDMETQKWTEKEYRLPNHLATISKGMSYTMMKDGSALMCYADRDMGSWVAYVFNPKAENKFEEVFDDNTQITYACRDNATLLTLNDGRILRLGGFVSATAHARYPQTKNNAVYDPSTKEWKEITLSRELPMYSSCVVLPDGNVLITGGVDGITPSNACRIFNTTKGWFTPTGYMNASRYSHAICLLPTGDVFVHGGMSIASNGLVAFVRTFELYDAATGCWEELGEIHKDYGRYNHTCIPLPDDEVLIIGGANRPTKATIYSFATNKERDVDAPPANLIGYMTIPVYE